MGPTRGGKDGLKVFFALLIGILITFAIPVSCDFILGFKEILGMVIGFFTIPYLMHDAYVGP